MLRTQIVLDAAGRRPAADLLAGWLGLLGY